MNIVFLNKNELVDVLEMTEVIKGVKEAYIEKAAGNVAAWPLVEHQFPELNAVTDIRSGGVFGSVGIHGAKLLNNFPANVETGLPVFTGMLMVFNSNTGMPLGVMDASHITSMRTGASAAIGASALARRNSETLLLVGVGHQSIYLLGATLLEMPQIKRVIVCNPFSPRNAVGYVETIRERLAAELRIRTEATIEASDDIREAVGLSDVILTVTRSTEPLIMKDWLKPGTHLSCIGADMEGKEEIDPEIFRTAKAFADDAGQCCRVGEMEIPAKLDIISPEAISGEIGQVLAGMIPGRQSEEEITVFDATGLAALDLVTAKSALALAAIKGKGTVVEM